MKNKYIQQLHIEIQEFESKVSNLKENQNVSFSFFRESFMHTQEIGRLLHELEFAQIEDMKNQMGKLVQFLSESETSKPKTSEELEKLEERTTDAKATDVDVSEINKGVFIKPTSIASNDIPKEAIKEDFPQFENDKEDEKYIFRIKRKMGNQRLYQRRFASNFSSRFFQLKQQVIK